MESTKDVKITDKTARQEAILKWLVSTCHLQPLSLEIMEGDASFRRYFRLVTKEKTFVVMDAPEPAESCRSFVAISQALRKIGLNAPEIIHEDIARGFLVLTDFGDNTYLRTLTHANADDLYGKALDALAVLQGCRPDNYSVPPFTADFMRQEWALHKEWLWCKLLGLSLPISEKELDDCYEILIESAINQPQVFMHRDYHSANLMALPDGGVGILDFQDAFIGPVTYDPVSLLRDCYIEWPEACITHWALSYLHRLQARGQLTEVSDKTFLRWFDFMGMQRHLKAMMTFARKQVRDHHPRYLRYIPRTLNYLIQVSRNYPELASLHDYLRITIQPAFERISK